jgi:hypothetical protein
MPRAARGVFQPAIIAPIEPRRAYGHSGEFSFINRIKDGFQYGLLTRDIS